MDPGDSRGERRKHLQRRDLSLLPRFILVLSALAILLVPIGLLFEGRSGHNWTAPLYAIFVAFTVDSTFFEATHPITIIGAFAAALATFLALAGAGFALFEDRIVRAAARFFSSDLVLVSDGADAGELADRLRPGGRVALLTPDAEAGFLRGGGIVLPKPGKTDDVLSAANFTRAKTVVLALRDEKLNAALAMGIAAARARNSAATPAIWCRVSDNLVADRISSPDFAQRRILVYDEARLTARSAFARNPAHASAERLGTDRMHFVVAGFGDLGRAMAEEAVFSGTVLGLGKPMVTILDKDARSLEAGYRAIRPALDMVVDMAFIPVDLLEVADAPALAGTALADLAARDDQARVTGIALSMASDADNLRLALALPSIRRRLGRYFAPTFMRVRDREACRFALAKDSAVIDPEDGIIPLEQPTRLVASDVLDTARRDHSAQLLHARAHLPGAHLDRRSSQQWEGLDETYRRSNRRSADHLAAKLWSLGLVSECDPHGEVAVEAQAHAAIIAPRLLHQRLGEDELLDRLSELEHRRWLADRVMDGWSLGQRRDEDLRHHPSLMAFSDPRLPDPERQKDCDQVRTLLGSIENRNPGEGCLMPELVIGLCGHRDLSTDELARGLGALEAELMPRLQSLLPRAVITLMSPLAPGADFAATLYLANRLSGRAAQLRLLVPEAIPLRAVLESRAQEQTSNSDDAAKWVAIAQARHRALLSRFDRVDIVRIGFAGQTDDSYGRDSELFKRGAARANAYIARRADILCLLWDQKPARGLGGTGDLESYRRNPSGIPPEFDIAVSTRPRFLVEHHRLPTFVNIAVSRP